MSGKIVIRGARQNNLKNVSLELKRGALTAVTGVSGSGKSSLAFETIYAEGMRRFVESQTTYARQFLQRLDKPDVESIEGLCPTVAVQAKNSVKTARSTVGTVTEVYDYLRLLYSKAGELYCPACDLPVRAAAIDEMIAAVEADFAGRRVFVMAPLAVSGKVSAPLLREMVRARGFSYVMGDGGLVDLETAGEDQLGRALGSPSRRTRGDSPAPALFIVVDRLQVEGRRRSRLADSLETALREGGGVCVVRDKDGAERRLGDKPVCHSCGAEVRRPSPQHLSFNNPLGACPACTGFGDRYELDMDAVIPDKSKSLLDGAIEPWNSPGIRPYVRKMYGSSPDELGVRVDVPYKDLTAGEKRTIFLGSDGFYGLLEFFDELKRKSYKPQNRFIIRRYQALRRCSVCGGSRLNREALALKLDGVNIAQACDMPLERFIRFVEGLRLGREEAETLAVALREILTRARCLVDIGLSYLTLGRLSRTLSGGEMQRIHLATYLSSRLTGTLYVLDEPTVGLHPRDTEKLLGILKDLRGLGNTVIVVEHDMQVVRAADAVVDLGPGAGDRGGRVVFAGPVERFAGCADSLTAAFFRGERAVSDYLPAGGR
ncbi:MAG: excinuclease ABC subunit A, partial [bacterium]